MVENKKDTGSYGDSTCVIVEPSENKPGVENQLHISSAPLQGPVNLHRILGFSAFIIPLVFYYFTTCPVVYYGDAGELIVAGYRWGIAHPPGYPLYVLLLGLFLRLPLQFMAPHPEFFQPVAWQANFFSAIFSAATIWLVYLIILRILRNPWYAFSGALLCATGKTFWSQSGIAEVYALNSFLTSLLVLLALMISEARRGSYLRLTLIKWGSLVWGLSLCNHHEALFLFPVWLTMLIFALQLPPGKSRHIVPLPRIVLDSVFFLILGLLPYLYLPIASSRDPVLNWGDPSSFGNFLRVLTRYDYRTVKSMITGELVTSFDILLSFLKWSAFQYFPLFLVFVIPGFGILSVKSPHRPVLLSIAVSLIGMAAVFIVYFAGIDQPSMFFLEVYTIPGYIALGILITTGVMLLLMKGNFAPQKLPVHPQAIGVILILLFACTSFFLNYRSADMSDNIAGYIYSHDVLKSLPDAPDKSALMTGGDEIFLFWYWKWVEGTDKNVALIGQDALGITSSWFWNDVQSNNPDLNMPDRASLDAQYDGVVLKIRTLEALLRENHDNYRFFMTSWDPLFNPLLYQGPWHMVVDGPVLEIEWDTETTFTDYPRASTLRSEYLFEKLLFIDRLGLAPFEEEIYERYAAACYNLSTFFGRAEVYPRAAEYASLCLRFDPEYSAGENNPTPTELLARYLFMSGDLELAKSTFESLVAQDPLNSLYHFYLSGVLISMQDFESAKRELEYALDLEPGNQFIRNRYNQLLEDMQNTVE